MNTLENFDKWNIIAKYLANECTESENTKLNNWINEDIENEIEFSEIKNDWEILNLTNTMKEINVDNAWERLKNRIEEDKDIITIKEKGRTFQLSGYMKYAALFLMLIGIGFITTKVYNRVSHSNMIEYMASNNSGNKVILSDGTRVFLNKESKLTYPKQFNTTERKVQLAGEAYFDVEKNPEKPFIIEVKNAEIKVLGTSFNVNTNLPDHQIEVFVETGLVQLTKINGNEESILISPGDLGIVSRKSIEKHKNTDENVLAWKTKHLVFKEENLNNVINVLNKVYNSNITCNDQSVLNLRFTSTFKNQDVDSILSVICLAFDLKTEEKDNQVILTKKKG